MIPIGILTYNRAQTLDVTLRSLSATKLPDDQKVIIFDDASNDPIAVKYLYSNDIVNLSQFWPTSKMWHDYGLDIIKSRNNAAGIKNVVPVIHLSNNRQKVVNASCDALRRLYKMFPEAENVILLQDDVVFNVDWLDRLIDASKMDADPPIGMIAGMHINKITGTNQKIIRCLTGSVCNLITPLGKNLISKFINTNHNMSAEFDRRLYEVITKGAGSYLINPPVCQHIGVLTIVRPSPNRPKKLENIDWKNVKWQIDPQSHGPFVIASNVRNFMKDKS